MAATKKAAEKAATKAAATPVAEKEQPKAAAKKAAAAIEVRVRTLYFDVALNRIVAEGETFETNEERLELLSGLGLVEKV